MSCIDPGVDVQRGSVEVKPAVPEPPAYLRQDMTVSVDIRVAARRNAVLVPTATHNEALAARCGRTIRVVDGRLGPGDAARRG
jgi:HlyD family secretion protein